MTTNPPRAALYARVSTARQAKGDPWASLPRQVEDLRALAVRMGFTVALEVVEQGGGAKADRPGWGRVLGAVRAGEVDVICAVAFDRLTRSENLGDFESLKGELRGLGVRLVTCKQGEVNLSGSADAEMLSDVQAVWSKGERLKTRERTMAGKEAKGRAGGYTGGAVPYGYGLAFDAATGAKTFPVHEAQAAVVREVFAAFTGGRRLADIALDLNERGIAPPGGRGAPATQWYGQQIRLMLTNPSYAGLSSWGRTRQLANTVASAAFVALVEREVWEDAQARVELLADRSPRGNYSPRPLSGILRCAACRVGMGFQKTYHAKNADKYVCRRLEATKTPHHCETGQVLNAGKADAVVLDYLRARLPAYIDGEGLVGGVAKARQPKAPPLAPLEKALAKARQRQANTLTLLVDMEAGDPLAVELRGKLAEYRQEIATLEAQLAEARKAGAGELKERRGVEKLRGMLDVLNHPELEGPALRKVFDFYLKAAYIEKVSAPHRPQELRLDRLQLRNGDWL